MAGLATEGMFTRLAFAGTPYTGDVLVVLSFRGGMDSLQAFVPTGDPNYATWRPNDRDPAAQLLPMGGIFGMHPAMASLKPFYDAGDFGVVQAVGMADANRSHFSAMEEMERAAPGSSLRTGWLDRVLGLRGPGQPFQATQMGSNSAAAAFLGPAPELAMWSIDNFGLHDADGATESATLGQRLARDPRGRAGRDGGTRAHGAGRTVDRRPRWALPTATSPRNGAVLPRQRTRRRAARHRPPDQAAASACRSPRSTTATGTCTRARARSVTELPGGCTATSPNSLTPWRRSRPTWAA